MKLKEKFFIIICFIAFIQPNFFVKINMLNWFSIVKAVLCTSILLIRSFKKNIKFDSTLILLLLWRICIFIPTMNAGGEIIKWGYQSIVFIGLYLLVKNYIDNKEAFKTIYQMIFMYVFLNILVMMILPSGIFPQYGIHFLGIRTRFTEFSIALMYISLTYYNEFTSKNSKSKRMLIISFGIALANIFIKWVATGIIVVLLSLFIYLLLRKKKKLRFIYFVGFLTIIILTVSLINGNLLNLFSGFLEMLNKDVTLTGRTIIWDSAMNVAEKYFWSGFGYVNDGNIIHYNNGLWQAHNTILQSICECGIFGTLIFFLMLYKQGIPQKEDGTKINALNVSFIFVFLIMMTTEIIYYYPVFIFIIFLIGNSKKRLGVEENDNK